MLDILIILLLISGTFFFFIGVVGLIRLPDVYTRMHATTKCDTLGAGLLLLALILAQPLTIATLKTVFIIVFIWITHPTAAHIIARASYHTRMPQYPDTQYIDMTEEEGNS
ncbi:monovalent cation/H(+) antiporter subunit G [Natranaerobius thermophilus]|uniref:Monovalent cation/proton antiporter, MnhG/PhaG subunit n=1 Tax=Natranaerobius thermophilus (strain ATCC BAA-1301 / DSM 18059 / JW/NM-WN-LF) TaxID=457570 RepID=B2A688_NATTJ|nr:monovalent cation/H(+) antiporter subunit G [Natranaerobius thermophilus]ACB84099.1 monovalent cation/proton antiporter, MnhG/PhaG subunit [Natranaerobius thermophilus JW/NM-WN-LF]